MKSCCASVKDVSIFTSGGAGGSKGKSSMPSKPGGCGTAVLQGGTVDVAEAEPEAEAMAGAEAAAEAEALVSSASSSSYHGDVGGISACGRRFQHAAVPAVAGEKQEGH
jgi:hypothetical protein